MNILQCGFGAIGKKLFPEFKKMAEASGGEITVYDPPLQKSQGLSEEQIESAFEKRYGAAFLCVPTEAKENGECDVSILLEMAEKAGKTADTVVIKSTFPVTYADRLPENCIYSPEFSSTTVHGGTQNFVILGGKRNLCSKIAELYKRIYPADFRICFTDIKTAIMAKYTLNTFLAAKVTYFNEIAQCCKKCGVEYDDVRNLVLMDGRISPSHTWVYNEQPYYDSHCFNKDIPAFNRVFESPLVSEVERINTVIKKTFER